MPLDSKAFGRGQTRGYLPTPPLERHAPTDMTHSCQLTLMEKRLLPFFSIRVRVPKRVGKITSSTGVTKHKQIHMSALAQSGQGRVLLA